VPGLVVAKQLTCPQCGDVMAEAEYRRFPSRLRLRDTDGVPLQPTGGGVLVRLAQRQVADPGDPGHAQAEARLAYLRENLGELMYDLRCPRGHPTVVTVPAIVSAMRHTPGRWVTPR
jgi:hypothetical protein